MAYKYESFETDHSSADIELVIKLENAEQQRRIADSVGEQQRQTNAYLVSAMMESSLRPNWFHQGSAFVLELLRVARTTGDKILLTASQAKRRVDELRLKGIETAQDVKSKLEAAGTKGIDTAQDVKHKLGAAGDNISKKGLETAQDVKLKLQGGLESAQDTALGLKANIQGTAQRGLDKVQEVATRVKNASMGLVLKVNEAWENITYNSNLTFVILEEETERQYRMASENQSFAIMNAFRVAGLIKALAPELYTATSEPSSAYYAKLLGEIERARRIKQDSTDKTAQLNGAATSRLISQKFAPAAPLPAKAAFVEEIKVTKPLTATM